MLKGTLLNRPGKVTPEGYLDPSSAAATSGHDDNTGSTSTGKRVKSGFIPVIPPSKVDDQLRCKEADGSTRSYWPSHSGGTQYLKCKKMERRGLDVSELRWKCGMGFDRPARVCTSVLGGMGRGSSFGICLPHRSPVRLSGVF